MESLQQGQEFANRGILLLCRVVMEGMNPGAKPEVMQGLHAYTGSQGARSISMPPSSGLKVLWGGRGEEGKGGGLGVNTKGIGLRSDV